MKRHKIRQPSNSLAFKPLVKSLTAAMGLVVGVFAWAGG